MPIVFDPKAECFAFAMGLAPSALLTIELTKLFPLFSHLFKELFRQSNIKFYPDFLNIIANNYGFVKTKNNKNLP